MENAAVIVLCVCNSCVWCDRQRLTAENARLRAALQTIAKDMFCEDADDDGNCPCIGQCGPSLARTALASLDGSR